ncbi:putative protein kinase [Trypanosoma rangeli]|uniref:Uncharacterized protein n=1 Tax=Trypanosoma rangeli TaxID=5698 RepID=A0A3R7KS31_TRYRA|nr:putative protein kinase [Trypanosoma rangeli]RNF12447.1 putative protein kinase [Trypanosoma rangeli]|eukprot:RNF12447.1 putative protein kinase [Trypanosoma rangeli]
MGALRGGSGLARVLSPLPRRAVGVLRRQTRRGGRSAPQTVLPNDPPRYYLQVRQVVFRVLQEHVGTAAVLARGKWIASLCDACDAVAHQEPLEAPLDLVMLRKSVDECLHGASGLELDPTQLDTIAELLTAGLARVVPKLPPPTMAEETQADTMRPTKRRRRETSLYAVLQDYRFGTEEVEETETMQVRGSIFPTLPTLPSVFAESAVCSVNCVTFEHLPMKYYAPEGMKRQLVAICSRIPNAFFLNVHCVPGEGCAVVSFNSNETAAAVMFIVNSANSTDAAGNSAASSRVNVIPATEAHQQLLWGPLVEKVNELEEKWRVWHATYVAHPPHSIRQAWTDAKAKALQLEQELQRLTSNEDIKGGAEVAEGTAASPSEEQLCRKLQLLQELLECKHIIDRAEGQMQELYPEAYAQYLKTGPMVATYSTSKANVSDHRRLLFITDLPCRLDDAELLQFFHILGLQPVHVWRDPTKETSICVEVPSVGHSFAVLRQLDGSGMRFCGAYFARDRVVGAQKVNARSSGGWHPPFSLCYWCCMLGGVTVCVSAFFALIAASVTLRASPL